MICLLWINIFLCSIWFFILLPIVYRLKDLSISFDFLQIACVILVSWFHERFLSKQLIDFFRIVNHVCTNEATVIVFSQLTEDVSQIFSWWWFVLL